MSTRKMFLILVFLIGLEVGAAFGYHIIGSVVGVVLGGLIVGTPAVLLAAIIIKNMLPPD